jgi:hypothetical protein
MVMLRMVLLALVLRFGAAQAEDITSTGTPSSSVPSKLAWAPKALARAGPAPSGWQGAPAAPLATRKPE